MLAESIGAASEKIHSTAERELCEPAVVRLLARLKKSLEIALLLHATRRCGGSPMRLIGGSNRSLRPAFLAMSMLFAFARPGFAQTAVTTCGQEVSGSATLPADLDCTGFDGNAVTVHGGTLAMNGHTITGAGTGIYCDHKCSIVGPGLVTGATAMGVNAWQTSIYMQQVDLTNNVGFGVQAVEKCVLVGPATISGNMEGVRLGRNAKLIDIALTGNQDAIVAADQEVVMKNGSVTGNTRGITADGLVKLTDVTVTGNGTLGVAAGPSNCVANQTNRFTASGGRVLLKGSTVTGNDTDPSCGTTAVCADIETCGGVAKLKLGSTCDHSYLIGSGNPGQTLHVCSLD
jgi:hypothetical protein